MDWFYANKSTYQQGEDQSCRFIKHLPFVTLETFFLVVAVSVYLHSSQFCQAHFKTTVLITVTSEVRISYIYMRTFLSA
jgi:hypothetical protein